MVDDCLLPNRALAMSSCGNSPLCNTFILCSGSSILLQGAERRWQAVGTLHSDARLIVCRYLLSAMSPGNFSPNVATALAIAHASFIALVLTLSLRAAITCGFHSSCTMHMPGSTNLTSLFGMFNESRDAWCHSFGRG